MNVYPKNEGLYVISVCLILFGVFVLLSVGP